MESHSINVYISIFLGYKFLVCNMFNLHVFEFRTYSKTCKLNILDIKNLLSDLKIFESKAFFR